MHVASLVQLKIAAALMEKDQRRQDQGAIYGYTFRPESFEHTWATACDPMIPHKRSDPQRRLELSLFILLMQPARVKTCSATE